MLPATLLVGGKMIKILAIDDDKSQLQLLRRILAERHYSVALAQNEQDALKLMERKRPLVVLSDLKLPGTDGFALLAKLRQIDPFAGFIVMTGYGSTENSERAHQLGVDRFLEKPLSLNGLLEAVRELVCQKRVNETRARLRLYHGGSCPFGSCILRRSSDSCSYFGCPYPALSGRQ